MVGRHPSSILTLVDREDVRQIQLIGYISDEPRQMILWNPVLQRGWEKENLIQVAGAESLAHTTTIPERETFYYINVLYFHNCTGPIYLRQTPSPTSAFLRVKC